MVSLAGSLIILWLISAVVLFFYSVRHRRREQELLDTIRRSPLYVRLYRKLDYLLRNYEIDQLRIEQYGVIVTSVMPAHTLLNFDFKQNGNSKRACAVSRLIMQLLYSDFPVFADQTVYKMSRYRVYRSNGKKEYGFSFTMRHRHKAALIRERMASRVRTLY